MVFKQALSSQGGAAGYHFLPSVSILKPAFLRLPERNSASWGARKSFTFLLCIIELVNCRNSDVLLCTPQWQMSGWGGSLSSRSVVQEQLTCADRSREVRASVYTAVRMWWVM